MEAESLLEEAIRIVKRWSQGFVLSEAEVVHIKHTLAAVQMYGMGRSLA
jgi:hypothetical protein